MSLLSVAEYYCRRIYLMIVKPLKVGFSPLVYNFPSSHASTFVRGLPNKTSGKTCLQAFVSCMVSED